MRHELKSLFKVVDVLDRAPTMYLPTNNYLELSGFISGYLVALEYIYEISYQQQFANWVAGKKTPAIWSYYVLHVLAEGDENVARRILLEKLKDFTLNYPS